jgi:hypothetical protein
VTCCNVKGDNALSQFTTMLEQHSALMLPQHLPLQRFHWLSSSCPAPRGRFCDTSTVYWQTCQQTARKVRLRREVTLFLHSSCNTWPRSSQYKLRHMGLVQVEIGRDYVYQHVGLLTVRQYTLLAKFCTACTVYSTLH